MTTPLKVNLCLADKVIKDIDNVIADSKELKEKNGCHYDKFYNLIILYLTTFKSYNNKSPGVNNINNLLIKIIDKMKEDFSDLLEIHAGLVKDDKMLEAKYLAFSKAAMDTIKMYEAITESSRRKIDGVIRRIIEKAEFKIRHNAFDPKKQGFKVVLNFDYFEFMVED